MQPPIAIPDPAHPTTRGAPPATPGSYLAGLRPDGLAGARIGVLHTSPAFIEAQDLLGSALGGAWEPHSSGLLNAGIAARELDSLAGGLEDQAPELL